MSAVPAPRRDPYLRVTGARGETLVELLVTVAILGIAVIAIVFGMGIAVKASGTDRKQGRMENLLRNGAEAISAAEYKSDGVYSLGLSSGQLTIGATRNRCLDVNGATATCDTGVQELTLKAQNGSSSKTLVIVKRNPAPGAP